MKFLFIDTGKNTWQNSETESSGGHEIYGNLNFYYDVLYYSHNSVYKDVDEENKTR